MFDNELWALDESYSVVAGSASHVVYLNEVWRSQDGVSWRQMPDGPWAPRFGQATVTFNGKLWLLGGTSQQSDLNDVWCMSPVTVSVAALMGAWREEGKPMDLKVTTTGISGPVGYQWMKNGSAIDGATTDIYHIDAVTPSDEAVYTCQATDQYNASFTADAVPVRIFPAGSLPVGRFPASMLTAIGCLAMACRQLRSTHAVSPCNDSSKGGLRHF